MKQKNRKPSVLSFGLVVAFFLSLTAAEKAPAAVTIISPTNYSLETSPSVGTRYYLDRTYTLGSLPSGFDNYVLIMTRNTGDKAVEDASHLVFTISNAATVYVAYDRRSSQIPDWLSSFSSTGDQIDSNGDSSMGYFKVYSKSYSAGTVTLGGNRAGGCCSSAGSNYIVFVDEDTAPAPLSVDPTALSLVPGDDGAITVTGGTAPYSAGSSNESAATESVSGNTVTVTAVADGTADITITDNAGSSETVSVTVQTVLSVQPDTFTLSVGELGTATVSGGTGPYSVSSGNESVATASIATSTVTITAVAAGTATITVSDNAGDSETISVTVTAALAVSPSSLSLNPGDTGTVTISGGSGSYLANSGNTSIATVSLSGSTLTVTAVSGGSINVTVTDSLSNVATVVVNVGGSTGSGIGDCPTPPFITGATADPNILLILDHSGSMGSGSGSRWVTAQGVVKGIIDDFPSVRFGLMRMDGSDYSGNDQWYSSAKVVRQGGKVLKPCGTPGDEIKTYIDNWGSSSNVPQTWTNLAETLASGGRYFATALADGSRVGKGPSGFGFYEKDYHYSIGGTSYDATTTDDKGNTIDTTSPIQYYCQKSFIIFITDGLANYDNDWDIVTDLIGDYDGDGDSKDCKNGASGCSVSSGRANYLDDVAKYLYDHDMRSDLTGTQNLTTYVVGFYVDDPLLSSAAAKGGGQYYTANNAAALTAALKSAITNILESISSGTAVATISTSAETDDYLLRAKFLPVSWKGYLESFTMPYSEGDSPTWEAGQILSNTSETSRNIYTYLSSEASPKQVFDTTNSTLTTYLATEWSVSETEAGDVMAFIRGDDTNEGGKYKDRGGWKLGDIIHSSPIVIGPPIFFYAENNYQTFKADNLSRTKMVYVGGNDGMLHAFKVSDGAEAWAFIPENILADLKKLTEENCHIYLVDQTPVGADVYDGTSWKTVLIGGNRLGGEEYFCLDVTDPAQNSFSILWDLVPFSDRKSSTMPIIGKVKGGAVDKWVAVIASGYHNGTEPGKIAALNFTDGAKETIWNDGTSDVAELTTQAKDSNNPYYTLSSPVGVDTDDDGYLDLIYAGDTEGALWKFYYDYVDTIWKKSKLFDTGGQPITARPSLAFDEDNKLRIFFATGKYLIGDDKSNAVQNTLYCLVEEVVSTQDANDGHYTGTTAISKANDLVDLTAVTTQALFDNLSSGDLEKVNTKGWYFDLDVPAGPAERVLEYALIANGYVFFTSFTPNQDVCGFGGTSKLYAIDYKTGLPAQEEGVMVLEDLEEGDKSKPLGSGLPSKPVLYYDPNTKDSKLMIQTSDSKINELDVNMEQKPLSIDSWWSG